MQRVRPVRQADQSPSPQDLNVLNFERFKWGGVRRDDIAYVAFDLEQFAKAPQIQLMTADIDLGQQIIDYLRRLPPKTTAAQAAAGLKMIQGNKAERDTLIDILGVCGILRTADYPAYADKFIPASQRTEPSQRFLFGSYPTWWWTAQDGISKTALQTFLPQLA